MKSSRREEKIPMLPPMSKDRTTTTVIVLVLSVMGLAALITMTITSTVSMKRQSFSLDDNNINLTPTPTPVPLASTTTVQPPQEIPASNPLDIPTLVPSTAPDSGPTPDTQIPIVNDNDDNSEATITVVPSQSVEQIPSTHPTTSPSTTSSIVDTKNPVQTPPVPSSTQPTTIKLTVSPSVEPTLIPTFSPTPRPSPIQSFQPSRLRITASPTNRPVTIVPTEEPTMEPSTTTTSPTDHPTQQPTQTPTDDPTKRPTQVPNVQITQQPTPRPVDKVTASPSYRPSRQPIEPQPSTSAPTKQPTQVPTTVPTALNNDEGNYEAGVTHFYAIGDVPYTNRESTELIIQVANIPDNAEFLIHVGDIRSARHGNDCEEGEYVEVAAILGGSAVPVFIVMGDNEWNDCPNINQGYDHWINTFANFDENWTHDFQVEHDPKREENFAFVHKRTLYIGLNLVGGRVHDTDEWGTRLHEQFEWVRELITTKGFDDNNEIQIGSVVLFGHANPSNNHNEFFHPLRDYIRDDLNNAIPFLYLNGDGHSWKYETSFFEQSNFLRIQVEGGTRDPPLYVAVDTTNKDGPSSHISDVFQHDRMLGRR